jgi:uncharacterized protein YndB with AHSA1/START domain
MRIPTAVIFATLALTPALSFAEVKDSGPGGFTVKITTEINASPADVYQRVVHNVGDWWSSDHTFSGDAHNLSIEDRPMGCFCEKLPDHGAARHMEVIYADPGKMLRLSGGLGPLQPMAVSGSMTLTFTAMEALQTAPGSGATGRTRLEVTYAVAGYMPGGMDALAKPVDGVLAEQFTRLKTYIETGAPGNKAR